MTKKKKEDNLPYIWPVTDPNDPRVREGRLMSLEFRARHLRQVLNTQKLSMEEGNRLVMELYRLEEEIREAK